MAKETISVDVHPDDELFVISEREAFGWEVVSSQRVSARGSDFVKLLFAREKNIENFQLIVDKENEYYTVKNQMAKLLREKDTTPYPKKKGSWLYGIIVTLLTSGLGLIYIIYLIVVNKGLKKRQEAWRERQVELEKQIAELDMRCDKIMNEAKALL